jgi:hypothetical protein
MATSIGKRSVFVGPAERGNCSPLQVEGLVAEAGILPGTLVQQAAANAGLEINDTAAAAAFGKQLLVADRNALKQEAIDVAWEVGEVMQAISPRDGEFFNVVLASGNNVTALDVPLTVNGAGKLAIAASDGTVPVLFYAKEILNAVSDSLILVQKA